MESLGQHHDTIVQTRPTRRERFFASYLWLILRNGIGWLLIVLAFVAGPFVPGPGGIPLFLIGFALISFPGKRRLTARVMRGKPYHFGHLPFAIVSVGAALAIPVLLLLVARWRYPNWIEQYSRSPLSVVLIYVVAIVFTWLAARSFPHVLNLLLRLIAKGRRRFRPWLRRHRIRLLPPRWRTRHPYESGVGPFRLKEEILKFYKTRRRHA